MTTKEDGAKAPKRTKVSDVMAIAQDAIDTQAAGAMLAPVAPAGPVAETAAAGVAAQAEAAIRARYALAQMRPRNWDTVRANLLRDCRRSRLADVAFYAKPVGGKSIMGPSIRFAEAVIQALASVYIENTVVFDDDQRRIIRVTATDCQSGLTYAQDIVVRKVVERRFLRDGQVALSTRTNSQGLPTYLVEATEDDLTTKQAALVSKAIRTLGLRLAPGWLIDEAMDICKETQMAADEQNPDAARHRMVDAFAKVGVTPDDLVAYLGHGLDAVTPAERSDLLAAHAALADGETRWSDIMEAKRGLSTSTPKSKPAATPEGGTP